METDAIHRHLNGLGESEIENLAISRITVRALTAAIERVHFHYPDNLRSEHTQKIDLAEELNDMMIAAKERQEVKNRSSS